MSDAVILVVGIFLFVFGLFSIVGIVYSIFENVKRIWNTEFKSIILCIIISSMLWYYDVFMKIPLSLLIIAFCIENLTSIFANDHKGQLNESLKNRECTVYRAIIAQCEERLYEKTRKIPQIWIEQWDEEAKQWERDVLEIKNPRHIAKASRQQPSLIKEICAQGYADTFFLYERALKTEFTSEHMERINELISTFEEIYCEVVPWMKENGIIVEKLIDLFTETKQPKPTILLLHWWLYMVDGMITVMCEEDSQEEDSGLYDHLASMGVYFTYRPEDTEYETVKEILQSYCSMPHQYKRICNCKIELVPLLYDISGSYTAARETFIYYKELIKTVKEGYVSFSENYGYSYSEITIKMNEYKEKDKDKIRRLCIDQKTPTFEEAYKLGVMEWMRDASEKCGHPLVFWSRLVRIENLRKRLQIIFGDEKVKALEEAIEKEQEKLTSKMNAAIFENKDFHYYKSLEYLIGYLQ